MSAPFRRRGQLQRIAGGLLCGLWLLAAPFAPAELDGLRLESAGSDRVTLVARETPVTELFEMLARHQQVDIVVSKEVEGEVSVSLFEAPLEEAISLLAEAAGCVAERRGGGFLIATRDDAGSQSATGHTMVRAFKVHHSDPESVAEILENHISRFGEVRALADRPIVVVEDRPSFLARIDALLEEVDRPPHQILIEAKILEITLEEDESYGIDWLRTFEALDGLGDVRLEGLASPPGSPGFFFNLVTPETEIFLTAFARSGRVRTLSTPTLLVLEHEEAEVVIGDRLGFRVVTTINEVTSESVEFLESGVILRIQAEVDRGGRIRLEVHPEVSTGVIDDGLPEQSTTEVTTHLIADDGQPILIGGLIQDRATADHNGMPYLRDLPLLGHLFSRREKFGLRTETIVVLTAHLSPEGRKAEARRKTRWQDAAEAWSREGGERIDAVWEAATEDEGSGP